MDGTIQFRGLPLDYEISTATILKQIETPSSVDPLLECVFNLVEALPQTSGQVKWRPCPF